MHSENLRRRCDIKFAREKELECILQMPSQEPHVHDALCTIENCHALILGREDKVSRFQNV